MKTILIALTGALCLSAAAAAQSAESLVTEAISRLDSGQESSARRYLERAEEALPETGEAALRAEMELGWARYWRWRRSWSRGAGHAEAAGQLFRDSGAEPSLIAEADYQAGYLHYRAGHIRPAYEAFARAVVIYGETRDMFDDRRLRANGWATMTRELAARLQSVEDEWGSGVFVIATHARAEDSALEAEHGAVWAHTDSPGFDVTAWHGRMDGFVVALIDAGPDGEPVNLRILESHPGDLWDLELGYALRTWRLDMSDPAARRTDIAVTFIWAVQRHQR